MSFSSAAGRFVALISIGMWFGGCSPISESELDEQKNPHFLEGKSRANALNHKGAIEAFEKALEANPRSASAHLELGLLYEQKMNDYAAAIYHLERHLRLRPTSHVAESVRQRIMSCKLELAKTVSFALVTQKVQAAMERLTSENSALQQQVEELKGQLAKAQSAQQLNVLSNRSVLLSNQTVTNQNPLGTNRPPAGTPQPLAIKPAADASRPAGSARTHVVQRNETFASISRKYGIPLGALQSANPRIRPRELKAGQTINLPAR
jgi:LysM repeat protein